MVAVLATGLGFGGATWLRQTGAISAPNLNFDSRAITFPALSETRAHVGAAWTPTPTVEVVVHIVNDGTRSVDLLGGSAAGFNFSSATLTPDTKTLAPGQAGTLHGSIKVTCASALTEKTNQGFAVAVRAKSGLGIPRTVRLELGDADFDSSLMNKACSGVRLPIDITTRVVTSGGTTAVQAIVHNVTAQELAANIVEDLNKPPQLDTIAPRATSTFTLTTDEACFRTPTEVGGDDPEVVKTYNLFVKTVTGSYATTVMLDLPDDPRLSALCHA